MAAAYVDGHFICDPVSKMKVWVIYDPLNESVVSVHATEESASRESCKLNISREKYGPPYYYFEYDEFEVLP